MPDAVTAVISAAGMGTRLGLSLPKALVPVDGREVLLRQLELLTEVEDVAVVVGYRAEMVIDLLRRHRPDVRVVLNHEYSTTGTAASLRRGALLAGPWVVSLDGDLLVRRDGLQRVLDHPGPCLGVTPSRSERPVNAELDDDGRVVALDQERPSPWEWSGLAKIPREVAVAMGDGHVFPGLARALPLPAVEIDCVEIDDLGDLEAAERWVVADLERHG